MAGVGGVSIGIRCRLCLLSSLSNRGVFEPGGGEPRIHGVLRGSAFSVEKWTETEQVCIKGGGGGGEAKTHSIIFANIKVCRPRALLFALRTVI